MVDQGNKRKNMLDREILDKYVDLEKLYLSNSEKKQDMDMLYNIRIHLV